MRVQTTKTMFKTLQKALRHNKATKNYKLFFEQLDACEYARYTSVYNRRCELDYNEKTGDYNVFTLFYPDNYFAPFVAITTNDLIKIFNNSNKTLNGFINEFINAYEI